MHRSEHVQFQRLPREARRATLWRLAWSGLAPEQIAERTGLSIEEVRSAMDDELAPAQPTWARSLARVAANA